MRGRRRGGARPARDREKRGVDGAGLFLPAPFRWPHGNASCPPPRHRASISRRRSSSTAPACSLVCLQANGSGASLKRPKRAPAGPFSCVREAKSYHFEPGCLFRRGRRRTWKRFVRRERDQAAVLKSENVLFGTLACAAASFAVLSCIFF